MIVVWQVFRFNSFAAPQVRVQIERQQRAITDGPYRIVRHPMYAGALLMFVGIGRVGLDLVAARLTPHDESDASRSRVAERHRRPGGSRLHCRGHERAGALINSACHGCTEVPK
jgi:hypothetical protein